MFRSDCLHLTHHCTLKENWRNCEQSTPFLLHTHKTPANAQSSALNWNSSLLQSMKCKFLRFRIMSCWRSNRRLKISFLFVGFYFSERYKQLRISRITILCYLNRRQFNKREFSSTAIHLICCVYKNTFRSLTRSLCGGNHAHTHILKDIENKNVNIK